MRSEFEFINHIKKTHGLDRIGDDCAVIPKDAETDLVITVDMLAEDIDFRLSWTDPRSLGHKALAVSLSDIAAMGADPKWAMLSIGVPESIWESEFLDSFYLGWHCLADQFGVMLIGGDVSRVPSGLIVDSIVAGEVPIGSAVMRSGAKPGDLIFVSAGLGGAAAGLRLLEQERSPSNPDSSIAKRFIEKQLRPLPRIELGQFLLRNQLASAMVDISDGLVSDLSHICEASGTGAVLDLVPFDHQLLQLFTKDERTDMALHGGEDFELLFTVPPDKIASLAGRDLIQIGTITTECNKIELIRDGSRVALRSGGFQHFK